MPQYDRQWVMRPDDRIKYWKGDTHQLFKGVTVVRCSLLRKLLSTHDPSTITKAALHSKHCDRLGGHFPGSSVLHVASCSKDGKGAPTHVNEHHCIASSTRGS